MAKAKDGYTLSVGVEFIEPSGEKLGDLTWNTYGYTNQTMDETGSLLIASLLATAAEMREAKAARDS